jgi:hypothetical protein
MVIAVLEALSSMPVDVNPVSVPTLVILVCAAVVNVRLAAPLTVKELKVPTLVILVCAAVVNVSAVAVNSEGVVVNAII